MTRQYITYPNSENYKWKGDPNLSITGSGFSVPRGIESILSYNGVIFNDTSVVDKYRVLSIDGLADPDVRDSREEKPGDDGEDAYDSYYGGRTLVIRVRIEAFQLDKLRDMEEALRTAFAVMEEKPLYFLTGDPEKDHYISCKKSTALTKEDNVQTFGHRHFREWQITLRASDPRFYRVKKKFLSRYVNIGPEELNATSAFPYENYRQSLISSNPIAAISLGNSSGTTNLSSGAFAVTTSGSISIGTGGPGIFGVEEENCTSFDNVDDSVTIKYPWCSNTLDRTLSIWFNPEDIEWSSGGSSYTLFGSDIAGGGQIGIDSEGEIFFQTDSTSSATKNSFGVIPEQNKWNHLIMTVNRSSASDNANLYLNGKFIKQLDIDAYGDTTSDMIIGAMASGGSASDVFKGRLAYPAIHGDNLTYSQMQSAFPNAKLFYDYFILDENVQVFVNDEWAGLGSSAAGTSSLQATFTSSASNYFKIQKEFSSGISVGEAYTFSGDIKYTRESEISSEDVYRPIDPTSVQEFKLRAGIVFYTASKDVLSTKYIDYSLDSSKQFKFNLTAEVPNGTDTIAIEIDAVSIYDVTKLYLDNLSLKTSQTFQETGYINLTNVGNYNSYPIIYLSGEMTGVEIINQNASEPFNNIKFKESTVIPSGGFYKIDTQKRTVTDNEGNNKISELDPTSGWLKLMPGENKLYFASSASLSSGADVQIAADWQDSWI